MNNAHAPGSTDWLLKFARMDLDVLRPGALADVKADVLAYPSGLGTPHHATTTRLPSTASLKRLQRDLRVGLGTLWNGKAWRLPVAPRRWSVKVADKSHASRSARLIFPQQPLRASFLAAAAHALCEAWTDIRKCPKCGELFFRVRRQKFCSTTCLWAHVATVRKRTSKGNSQRTQSGTRRLPLVNRARPRRIVLSDD